MPRKVIRFGVPKNGNNGPARLNRRVGKKANRRAASIARCDISLRPGGWFVASSYPILAARRYFGFRTPLHAAIQVEMDPRGPFPLSSGATVRFYHPSAIKGRRMAAFRTAAPLEAAERRNSNARCNPI